MHGCTGTVLIQHTSMTKNPGTKLVKHLGGLKCTPDRHQPQLTEIIRFKRRY